jgi:Kef-type K+ transport system membrane component KefB
VVLFFILAGGALDIGVAASLGGVGLGFVISRTLARLIGGAIGAKVAQMPTREGTWFGAALLPQAGVAIGMALIAAQRFPDWGPQIIALTIGTTVVFEILGPIATLMAIRRTQKRP